MSEFQISLLAIGALVVCGVLGYNKWQEQRARREAREAFRSELPDALIAGAAEPASAPSVHEPVINDPDSAAFRAHPEPRVPVPKIVAPGPGPGIDYTIDISGEGPVAAALLRDGWAGMGIRFGNKAALSVLVDEAWVEVPTAGSFQQGRAALQLVSRQGVVSEAELIEFRAAVESFTVGLGLSAASPEMKPALEVARRVDQVCADADIQIAFHMVAPGGQAFSGTKLRAAAEASGLAIDADGRFSLLDDEGRELFNLSDRSGARFSTATMKDAAPQAVTLSMDVPRAPDTQRTFESMVRFARTLANLLGGGLVDDNNQPLDDRSVAAIGAQLGVVRANLEALNVIPGNALALRLFS